MLEIFLFILLMTIPVFLWENWNEFVRFIWAMAEGEDCEEE